jgi:SWI/SNF-related matrix-associated actin-dependent regulator of chromatin subfamily A-like protein 1
MVNNISLHDDQTIAVRFDYHPDLVTKIKELPSRKWVPAQKIWTVPFVFYPEVLDFAKKNKFVIEKNLYNRINGTKEPVPEELSNDLKAKYPVYDFQIEGIHFLQKNKKAFLADQMGLGKTVESILAIKKYPVLVVCPATLKYNWRDEVKKWLEIESFIISKKFPEPMFDHEKEIYIINYDILGKHLKSIQEKDFGTIIFDESHYLKNRKAQRSQYAKTIAEQSEYVYLLTGTPIMNRPVELVNQLETINRLKSFGGWFTFVKRYCNAAQTKYGWDLNGASNLDELHEKLKGTILLRRLKKDVLKDLPDKQYSEIFFDLDNLKDYKRAENDLISFLKQEGEYESAMKASQAEQLVKIEYLKQLATAGKLESVKQWISDFLETGEKLVVFATHVETQKELLTLSNNTAAILGIMEPEDRSKNVDKFQNDPTCNLMVASLQAGGVGITLTAASHVAFVELGWTPAIHDQAESRLHRIGQKDNVNVYYFLANNSIDTEIFTLLQNKASIVENVMDGIPQQENHMVKELLQRLAEKR